MPLGRHEQIKHSVATRLIAAYALPTARSQLPLASSSITQVQLAGATTDLARRQMSTVVEPLLQPLVRPTMDRDGSGLVVNPNDISSDPVTVVLGPDTPHPFMTSIQIPNTTGRVALNDDWLSTRHGYLNILSQHRRALLHESDELVTVRNRCSSH